jgi:predicted lipoprotein with Yx(FWY)xxD motif
MNFTNFLKRFRFTTGLFGLLIAISFTITTNIYSQPQGSPVSNNVNDQINPAMTTDGSGGTIITWQDKRNGKYEIYAQRMSPTGVALWQNNGVIICSQDSNYNPIIVSDDLGGAIISWQSYRGSATADIFAQHINASGLTQWTLNGVPICVVVFEQENISMISDGLGGAILVWEDSRSNSGFADIYSQRVNNNGITIWTANGVSVCNQAASQGNPKITSNGSGGAFITWQDNRAGNFDIYTQLISSGGAPQWTTNGVATCTMATDQLKPDLCSDGANGVIITWYDRRSTTDFNIYAQRQGPAGAIVWVVDGIVMNNNVAYDQTDPQIVSDGMGGGIISWTDYRTGVTADIYAQRCNSTGAVQWTATGVIICTESGDQIKSQLVSDGNSGAYITWEDHRNAGNADIYAQRIASNAAINWAATGFPICTQGQNQLRPRIVSNGNLGAIVTWQDFRNGFDFDIYEIGFNTSGVLAIHNNGSVIPSDYSLSQNYPNPFNPSTNITYQIKQSGNVKLSIYDAQGRKVTDLVNGTQTAGSYTVSWNAEAYSTGVYFYQLEAGSVILNNKMILTK